MRVAFCPSSREALRPNIHLTHRRREIGWVVGDRQVAQCAGIKANPSERLGRRNNWRPARKRFDGLDGLRLLAAERMRPPRKRQRCRRPVPLSDFGSLHEALYQAFETLRRRCRILKSERRA
jgi:hypothetical protein